MAARVSGFVGVEKIEIEIAIDALQKRWTINERENAATNGCTDFDLNFSPATNTLPIRRLNLKIGAKKKVRAAWLIFSLSRSNRLNKVTSEPPKTNTFTKAQTAHFGRKLKQTNQAWRRAAEIFRKLRSDK